MNYLASYQQSHNYQIIKKWCITNRVITNKRQVYWVQLYNLNFFSTSLLGLVHMDILAIIEGSLEAEKEKAAFKTPSVHVALYITQQSTKHTAPIPQSPHHIHAY